MKRKRLPLPAWLSCIILFPLTTLAQFEIGVTGGYNKNYVKTSAGYRPFTEYDARSGFVAGIPGFLPPLL